MAASGSVAFGDIVVSFDRREVVVAGSVHPLEPQAFDLLAYLVVNAERAVPKHELLDEVWGHRFVTEASLTTRIKQIRQALGDDGQAQRVIRTVRGHGYQFVADVGAVDDRRSVPPHQLFGRDDDVSRIMDLLASTRIVTLVGPGGVGKTSLAEAVAAHHRDAVLVPLGAIESADAILPAWCTAAGLTSTSIAESDALATLAGRNTLHVLDNCEHVVDAVARLLSSLPPGPAQLLTTSRERLGVADEQLFVVEPLDADAARALFIDRAVRSRPDSNVDEEHLEVVDSLVASVDHLPLAIEMAAGRVGATGLGDLAALLQDAPQRLDTVRRDAAARHRSLGDLIDWSLQLLSADERRVLAAMSVFAGSVALDDVVGVLHSADPAVVDEQADLVGLVASLVERSLVSADTSRLHATYRLLETTRAHVAAERPAAVDVAHARWYAGEAERLDRDLRSVDEPAAHQRIVNLFDELRRTHRWALKHDVVLASRLGAALRWWAVTRMNGEVAAWAQATYDLLPAGDPGRADLAAHLAAAAGQRLDHRVAAELAAEAVEAGDISARLAGLDTLINTSLSLGDLDAADRWCAALDELAVDDSNRAQAVLAVVGRALAEHHRGNSQIAADVVDGFGWPDDLSPTERGWLHYAGAEVASVRDPQTAFASHRRALELASAVDSRFLMSVTGSALAELTGRFGDPDEALALYRDVLNAQRRDGNLTHAMFTLQALVVVSEKLGLDQFSMVLLGALSGVDVAAIRWAEVDAVEDARTAVIARQGPDAVRAWIDDGAGTGPAFPVLDRAIAMLDVVVAEH